MAKYFSARVSSKEQNLARQLEIVKEYAANDKRIRMIQRANDGFAKAKNQGLQFMNSTYVIFMKTNDTMMPDFISNMVQLANKSNADIVVSNNSNEDYDKALSGKQWMLDKTILMRAILKDELKSNMCGKLFKRSLFNTIKFKEDMSAEDFGIMHLIFDKADKIAYDKFAGYFKGIPMNKPKSKNDIKKIIAKQMEKKDESIRKGRRRINFTADLR